MKPTILIFGISSFLGSNLAQILKDDFRIVGTYHNTPVDFPGITCLPCDVLKKDYVNNLLAIFQPDFTIYAVGMSSLNACRHNPKLADALNSAGAVNCCTASERVGSKFIFLSSSFVLGGEESIVYKEADIPFPNTVYGSSLSAGEFYIQRSCLNYLILRCAPLYGRSYNHNHENWFETLQTSFAKQQPIYADENIHTGFLDVYILAKILQSALEANVTNRLFQVSSKDWLTRYEFAKLYAKIFKKDEALIQRVSGNFPSDSSKSGHQYFYKLDITNIEEFLGTKMPRVEDSLLLTYKRLHSSAKNF